jgi:DNA-3-methyladenine glycosylase
VVARDLLGCRLVSNAGGEAVEMTITEVEAYLGPRDRACHTWGGRRTPRVESMYGEAGHAYVYLIYGLHRCLNVVTVGGGAGEAVLIRGGVVERGHEVVRDRRGGVADEVPTDGPGKLGQAVGLTLDHDGVDLTRTGSVLWIGGGERPRVQSVQQTRRIGIPNTGEAAGWRLRWAVVNSPR